MVQRRSPRSRPRAKEEADDHRSAQDATGSNADRVVIFDTTLRDGEQCPGATMTFEEKLEVAECLDGMGVDIIEAGFPIASDGDFEAVSAIAGRVQNATVAGLARAINADIDRAGEAVKHAKRGRIHTFVSTSPIHLAHQMRKTEAEVLEIITATVTRARNLVEDVEWSAMDATRTGIDYLCQCVDAAIKAGATTINLPDTVGYATPEEYAAHVPRRARARAECRPGRSSRPTATTTSAWPSPTRWRRWAAGARQIECTINGIGERAGNAALEEIVMAMQDAPRRAALRHGHRFNDAVARLAPRLGGDQLPGAVQQGHRRPERLRARERHPPGRHPQVPADLRDHDAGIGRRRQVLAGHGQALGPQRLPLQAEGARLRAGRERLRGRLRALQGPRRPQEARLRRGHRGAGRRRHRPHARPHEGRVAARSSPATWVRSRRR